MNATRGEYAGTAGAPYSRALSVAAEWEVPDDAASGPGAPVTARPRPRSRFEPDSHDPQTPGGPEPWWTPGSGAWPDGLPEMLVETEAASDAEPELRSVRTGHVPRARPVQQRPGSAAPASYADQGAARTEPHTGKGNDDRQLPESTPRSEASGTAISPPSDAPALPAQVRSHEQRAPAPPLPRAGPLAATRVSVSAAPVDRSVETAASTPTIAAEETATPSAQHEVRQVRVEHEARPAPAPASGGEALDGSRRPRTQAAPTILVEIDRIEVRLPVELPGDGRSRMPAPQPAPAPGPSLAEYLHGRSNLDGRLA